MNRRDFVVSGAATTALACSAAYATLTRATDLPLLSAGRGIDLYKIIFDSRFEPSRAFGAAASSLGARMHAIAGDITALWFHELHPLWAQGAGAIAGMTSPTTLFCLEQLAWDQQLRVVFRAVHAPQANGSLLHTVTADEATGAKACGALRNSSGWQQGIATQLLACAAPQPSLRRQSTVSTAVPADGVQRETLVSWLITA